MKTQNNSTTKIASTIHYLPITQQYRYIKMLFVIHYETWV